MSDRIALCDAAWLEWARQSRKGDAAMADQAEEQARNFDPRVPPGRGPDAVAAVAERKAAAVAELYRQALK